MAWRKVCSTGALSSPRNSNVSGMGRQGLAVVKNHGWTEPRRTGSSASCWCSGPTSVIVNGSLRRTGRMSTLKLPQALGLGPRSRASRWAVTRLVW